MCIQSLFFRENQQAAGSSLCFGNSEKTSVFQNTTRKEILPSHLVGYFPFQHLPHVHSPLQCSHRRCQDPCGERGLSQLVRKHLLGWARKRYCLLCTQPSAPAPGLDNRPLPLPSSTAPSSLGSYRGCFTSIFIFCFGVRSP